MIRPLNSTSLRYFDKCCNRKFDASLIGLAAQGVGNMATAAMNMGNSRRQQRRNYRYNQLLMQEQNQMNIENWNRQNEYNLPVNLVKRLKDAGINPALYLSHNSAGGVADSISSANQGNFNAQPPDLPDFGSSVLHGLTAYQEFKNFQKGIERQDLQNKILQTDLDYRNEYLNYMRNHGFPSQSATDDLNRFNSETGLFINSLGDLTKDAEGKIVGYYDDNGEPHWFTPFQKMKAQEIIGNTSESFGKYSEANFNSTQYEQIVKMNDEKINQIRTTTSLAINDFLQREIINKHQAAYLDSMTKSLTAQAKSLDWNLKQLEKSVNGDGKDYNSQLKELQIEQEKLRKQILKFQDDMNQEYGEIGAVMNQIITPFVNGVSEISNAIYGKTRYNTNNYSNTAITNNPVPMQNPFVNPTTTYP